MPDLLDELEPKILWRYFLELSKIPRPSKGEAAAAAWVAEQGQALGCVVERDEVGNVLIRKPASRGRQGRPAVALQGHVDMVCEKNEGHPHDFSLDPIAVQRVGDLLRASGTTLGADNGIGVAAALAVLATPGLEHPPLEVLITVDEETGLSGANGLKPGWLTATTLLNLDSEEEGELTIGCAGGIDTVVRRSLTRAPAPAGAMALRLKVAGLKGGHSGIDIGAGRGNSLRVLGHVLSTVLEPFQLDLAKVWGGNKRNAIPREASAVVLVAPEHEREVAAAVARAGAEWRAALGGLDPNLAVTVEKAQVAPVMSRADAEAVVGLLLAGPHGVEAMSPDIAGLVQTSTNMGLAETTDDAFELVFLSRSSIDASKLALAGRVAATARLAGCQVSHSGGYPGWKPEPGAKVVTTLDAVHRELYGKPMAIKAIHAGLECGLIGEKYPGLEMASIGPSMWDVHTPDEHVSIPSVGRFWTFLTAALARL
jgi:dipeptidase D